MEPMEKYQEEKLHFYRKGKSKVRITASVRGQAHLELIHPFLKTKNSLIKKGSNLTDTTAASGRGGGVGWEDRRANSPLVRET